MVLCKAMCAKNNCSRIKTTFYLEYITRTFACTITCIGHSVIYFKISNEHNHLHFMHFLFKNYRFILLSMTNEIVKNSNCIDADLSANFNFCDFEFDPFKLKKVLFV